MFSLRKYLLKAKNNPFHITMPRIQLMESVKIKLHDMKNVFQASHVELVYTKIHFSLLHVAWWGTKDTTPKPSQAWNSKNAHSCDITITQWWFNIVPNQWSPTWSHCSDTCRYAEPRPSIFCTSKVYFIIISYVHATNHTIHEIPPLLYPISDYLNYTQHFIPSHHTPFFSQSNYIVQPPFVDLLSFTSDSYTLLVILSFFHLISLTNSALHFFIPHSFHPGYCARTP